MNIKNNIWKFGMFSFLDHIRLIWMINTLYLLWLGFSFTNIGLFETIFAIVIVLAELPTGALSDLIGRKRMLFISSVFNGVGFILIGFMHTPSQYYLIALIMGIAFSFSSGTDIALLYDSLKRMKKENDYKKIRGKINAINQVGLIIGVFAGPAIFLINPRLNFILTGLTYLMGSMIVMTMIEPYKTKIFTLRKNWEQTKNSLKFTVNHPQIMWLIFFFFFMYVGIELFNEFWQQPLLVNQGIEVKYFGILFAIFLVLKGLSSYFTHQIEGILKENFSLFFIIFSQIIIYFLFSLQITSILLIAFGALYMIMAFQDIIFEDYINRHIPSSKRATVLSIKSLFYNLLTAGIYVSVGKLIDLFSINVVLVGTSIALLIGGIFLLISKSIALKKINSV